MKLPSIVSVVLCAVQCSAVQYSIEQNSVVYSAVQYSIEQNGVVYSVVQYSVVEYQM
jgi:hypothetical protein